MASALMQQIELPGVWLERGCVDAAYARLLDSPLGWVRQRVLATLWFATGAPLIDTRREALIDSARDIAAADSLSLPSGITSPHAEVVALRALAPRVEPAMTLLTRVWANLKLSSALERDRGRLAQAAKGLSARADRYWKGMT